MVTDYFRRGTIIFLRAFPLAGILCFAGPDAAQAQTPRFVPGHTIEGGAPNRLCGPGRECRFQYPYSVTSDSLGNVIVADTYNRQLKVFDAAGEQMIAIYGENETADISSPPGDPTTSCAVYEQLDANGFPIVTPGIQLTRTNCFSQPSGIAVDSKDRIYVADSGNHRVMVFCPVANVTGQSGALPVPGCPISGTPASYPTSLQFITALGTFGGPIVDPNTFQLTGAAGAAGELDQPTDVVVDRSPLRVQDRVYVLDSFNSRVQSFDLTVTGTTYSYAPFNRLGNGSGSDAGQFAQPFGFGLDQATGNIAIAEYQNNYINIYTPSGALVQSLGNGQPGFGDGEFSSPLDAAYDSQQQLWVTDSDNARLQVFSPAGVFLFALSAAGDLAMSFPQGIEADQARQRMIVADTNNSRIEIWQPAMLGVSAAVSAATPVVGDPFFVNVTLTNAGQVPLDGVRPFVTVTSGGSRAAVGTMPPAVDGLQPGASASFQVPVTPFMQGAVTLSISAVGTHTPSGVDLNAANQAAQTVTSALTIAAASVPTIGVTSVQPSAAKVLAGQTFTLTVQLTNGSASVTLRNPSLTIVPSGPVSGPTSTSAGATQTLPPGASRTFVLTYSTLSTGNASFAVVASATVDGSTPVQTITSAEVASATVQIVADVTAPTTRLEFMGTRNGATAPNAANFWNQPVIVTWTATDNAGGSEVEKICISAQAGQHFTCSIPDADGHVSRSFPLDGIYPISYFSVDKAGNAEGIKTTVVPLQIDQNPPVIQYLTPSPAPNAHNWNNTPVTLTVTVTDNLSGVLSTMLGTTALADPSRPTITLSIQGEGIRARVVASDLAGNVTEPAISPSINIDMIAPSMTALVVGNTVTFPLASPTFLNGIGDAPPAAVVTPAGITVAAFRGADVDPSTLPPPAGIPFTGSGVTWTLCDLASNCTTITATSARPDLVNQFNVAARDDGMYVQYDSTGPRPTPLVPVLGGKNLRTYAALDANGNGVTLVEAVKKAGKQVHAEVVSFFDRQGCPGPSTICKTIQGSVPGGTTKKFEWSDNKDGSLKELEQDMTISEGSSRIHVKAHYDSKKNQTDVDVDGGPKAKKVTLPGLVLLQMATRDGALVIRYNDVVIAQ